MARSRREASSSDMSNIALLLSAPPRPRSPSCREREREREREIGRQREGEGERGRERVRARARARERVSGVEFGGWDSDFGVWRLRKAEDFGGSGSECGDPLPPSPRNLLGNPPPASTQETVLPPPPPTPRLAPRASLQLRVEGRGLRVEGVGLRVEDCGLRVEG